MNYIGRHRSRAPTESEQTQLLLNLMETREEQMQSAEPGIGEGWVNSRWEDILFEGLIWALVVVCVSLIIWFLAWYIGMVL